MSRLKAKDPTTTEPSKPKMIVFGGSGVGKTWFAMSFPAVYYIACEPGNDRAHYMERLKAGGGVFMGPESGSLDFAEVIEQFKALATEKHRYKTVVIDSITKLFNNAIANETERMDREGITIAFGNEKKSAVQYMRRLIAATNRLDMNVIFIAHETSEWGNDSKGNRVEIGKKPDCYDKLIYELDLGFAVTKQGANRYGMVRKSRLVGFPEGERFVLDFATFSERYGKDIIEKDSAPIVIATPEQIAEIKRLINLLKVEQTVIDKWLEKANAETIEEFPAEYAGKVIELLNKKLTTK
jgi:adenosyl cobinamide kinase/adenosyl cobinamide phosphate guanylyltransferase